MFTFKNECPGNQFRYNVVNQVANLFRFGRSNLHVISLDATKDFDKLWREGLFFILIGKIDDVVNSKSILNIKGKNSDSFNTTHGVKQGGVMSLI